MGVKKPAYIHWSVYEIFTVFVLCALVLVVAACSTTPTPISQARTTPKERIYYRTTEGGPTATAVFIRDSGFLHSPVYKHLSINGEKAASIDVGEKVTFRLPAGDYVFGIIPTELFGVQEISIDQRLEAGRTYFYRIMVDSATVTTRIQRVIPKSFQ